MEHRELQQLVADWIADQHCLASPDRSGFRGVDTAVFELCEREPETAWSFILAVLAADQSRDVVGPLADGPLDELLRHHGDAYIERVEQEAVRDPEFRTLLGSMGCHSTREDIWQRLLDATADHLVRCWIAYHRVPSKSPEGEKLFWIVERYFDLCFDEPERAWDLVLGVLRSNDYADDLSAILAAGPLETLLSNHGDDFIDRVEHEAEADPAFRHLLRGVWRCGMSEPLWRRVMAAAAGA